MIIGVDTGGTFTDFVYKKGDRWGIYKAPSTPQNPAVAVLQGLGRIAGNEKGQVVHGQIVHKQIVHGSTVATNAILERKGAKTAIITNKGFEDIIEIGRQNRERLYDLLFRRPPRIVPSGLRFGVRGRILSTGEEKEPLDTTALGDIVKVIKGLDVESVAVCFLFSFVNPSHEQKAGAILKEAGIPFFLSHDIVAEFREFERTSTTVINAYVSPKMQSYIGSLISGLNKRATLSIMQSNGGRITAETAMEESVRTILSGPAGGAVGAFEVGKTAGRYKLISFDMGGTSSDVCLIDGALPLTTESNIQGYPIQVPMIDIHTVGAGGGSIAYLDQGGSLRVGPQSAGAAPGPICYGKGEMITVTDANLFLGRLIPDRFLAGQMRLDKNRLDPFFSSVASQAGISTQELAEGILAVVNSAMEKAIRVISVERGYDPAEFTLLAFGGAGAMHAAFLAGQMNIPRVLVPKNPGILSAMGMLMADVIKDYSITVMRSHANTTAEDIGNQFALLEKKGIKEVAGEGILNNVICERHLDMRYEGQSYEIMVPYGKDYISNFHSLHEKTYGYQNKDRSVEIVNLRLRARGTPNKPRLEKIEASHDPSPEQAFLAEHEVVFDHKKINTKVFERERLKAGNRIDGPAIVTEYSSTTVIPPFASASVDEYGNIIIEI